MCIVKGEAQKSPLVWRVWGAFDFLRSTCSLGIPLEIKTFELNKFTDFYKHPRLYDVPSLHTVDISGIHFPKITVIVIQKTTCKKSSGIIFWESRISVLSVPKTLRFENAETLRFLFRGPKIASDFSAISSAIFWRFSCDFCGKACDLVLCDLKTQRFFCDCDFWGR